MPTEVVEPMIPPVLQIATSPLARPIVSVSTSEDDGDAFFDHFTTAEDGGTAQENPDASLLAAPHGQQWSVTGLAPWPLANATVQPEILPTSPLMAAIAAAPIGTQALIAPNISMPAEALPPLDATTVSLGAPLPLPRSDALAGVAAPRDHGVHSILQAQVIAPQKVTPTTDSHPTTETAADAAGRRPSELQAMEQQTVFAGTDAKTAPDPEGKAPPVAPGRHEGHSVTQLSITEQVWVSQGLFSTPPDSANEDQKAIVGDNAQSESHEKPTSLPNLAHMEEQTNLSTTKMPTVQTASGDEAPASNLPETARGLAATGQALPRLAPQAQPAILVASEAAQITATTAARNDAPVLSRSAMLSPVAAALVVAKHGGESALTKASPSDKPQTYPSGVVIPSQTVIREFITSPTVPFDDGIAVDPRIAAQSGEAENVATGAAPLSQITVATTSTVAGQAVPLTAHQPLAPTLIAIARDVGPGTVELTLAPEELGNLRITLVPDGDTMRIILVAERPETLDLLRRHASQLTQEFRQAGFSGTSLSFAQGGAGGFTGSQPPPDHAPISLPEPAPLLQAMPAGHRLGHVAMAGLDLRL